MSTDDEKISRRGMIQNLALGALTLTSCSTAQVMPGEASEKTGPDQKEKSGASGKEGRLAGQVAFVTGSARGIGRAIAIRMAQEGADIINVDIAQAGKLPEATATSVDHAETERLVKAAGARCLTAIADVRSYEQLQKAVEKALSQFGKIDILVANAGIFGAHLPVESDTEQNWQQVIDINLGGVARSVRAIAPHMISRKQGKILMMSSGAGRSAVQGEAAYVASKWGVNGFMKAAALDLGKYGIRVNSICPAWVETSTLKTAMKERGHTPALLSARMPLKSNESLISSEEIAGVAVFLASEECRSVTGIAFDIQRGLNATNLG